MAEAEEVMVEEVVEGVEEVHLVDEGVEEEEEEVRRETGMIVLESNLTHSDINSLVVYSRNLKVKNKQTETDSLFIS